MMGLTHTVRHATWDSGIRASAICPGFANARMSSCTAAVAELLVNCRREDMV